ncbi:MAG: hypothetical protein IKT32_03060 [Clostridia bacterium]|nr:hypothetical protein [Clostridia bacterium]
MFSIYDGRKHFYQWDINQKLIVNDSTITEVHFSNCLCTDARKCETYTEGALTLVDVPNDLLTEYLDINVYAYDSGATKHSATFEVVRRTKPADYVYTPEELKSWEEINEQVKANSAHIVAVEDATYILEDNINEIKGSMVGKKTPNGGEIFNDYATNTATAKNAAVFGTENSATQSGAFAAGSGCNANNVNSVAIGRKLTTNRGNQAVFGQYNTPTQAAIFVIGGGTSEETRKNVFTVLPNGNATISGVAEFGGGAISKGSIILQKGDITLQDGSANIKGNLSFGSVSPSSMEKTLYQAEFPTEDLASDVATIGLGMIGQYNGQLAVTKNNGYWRAYIWLDSAWVKIAEVKAT